MATSQNFAVWIERDPSTKNLILKTKGGTDIQGVYGDTPKILAVSLFLTLMQRHPHDQMSFTAYQSTPDSEEVSKHLNHIAYGRGVRKVLEESTQQIHGASLIQWLRDNDVAVIGHEYNDSYTEMTVKVKLTSPTLTRKPTA